VIVLLAWLAAVLVAAVVAAVLAFDALGHLRRLTTALAEAGQDLTPQVQGLVDRLPAPATGARPAIGDAAWPGGCRADRSEAGRRGTDR
jgi:hypothetical protein